MFVLVFPLVRGSISTLAIALYTLVIYINYVEVIESFIQICNFSCLRPFNKIR